ERAGPQDRTLDPLARLRRSPEPGIVVVRAAPRPRRKTERGEGRLPGPPGEPASALGLYPPARRQQRQPRPLVGDRGEAVRVPRGEPALVERATAAEGNGQALALIEEGVVHERLAHADEGAPRRRPAIGRLRQLVLEQREACGRAAEFRDEAIG